MDVPEKDALPPQPPPKVVLLLTGTLVLMGMVLGSGILAIACEMQNLDLQKVLSDFGKDSPLDMRNFMRGALLIQHLMSFLVPVLLMSALLRYRNWSHSFLMERAPSFWVLMAALACVFLAFPLAQVLVEANAWAAERIPVLASLMEEEKASRGLYEGLLVMQSPSELLFSLLVMAAVPALGEELVFRGVVQQQLMRRWRPGMAILGAALVFGLIHFQFKEFFALFGMGVLLGYLFYWTQNLWVAVAGHFAFNGAQVLAAWQGVTEEQMKAADQPSLATRMVVVAASTVLLALTLNWLRKNG